MQQLYNIRHNSGDYSNKDTRTVHVKSLYATQRYLLHVVFIGIKNHRNRIRNTQDGVACTTCN